MLNKESLKWDAKQWRIRCTGYIINLAVQAFLFQNILDIEELESYNKKEKNGEKGDDEEKRAKFRLMGPLGQCRYTCFNQRARVSLYCNTYALLVGG